MDRRVRRTINSIETAFIQLLKHYDLEELTIQQIADEADINRATFYTYYQDKYDLLNALEDREITRIKENIDYEEIRDHAMNHPEDLNNLIKMTPHKVIQLILNNIELYEVLFSMKRQSKIEQKLSETIAFNLTNVLSDQKDINNIPFRYFHSFMSGAMISTIKFWVLDPDKIPEDEFIRHFYTLLYTGPFQQLVPELSKQTSQVKWINQ